MYSACASAGHEPDDEVSPPVSVDSVDAPSAAASGASVTSSSAIELSFSRVVCECRSGCSSAEESTHACSRPVFASANVGQFFEV